MPSSGGTSHSLSGAAAAGIGIALGAIVLGGALIVALYLRGKRRRGITRLAGRPPRDHRGDPPPTYELDTKAQRNNNSHTGEASKTQVFEIYHPPKPPSPLEIDGHERSRISVTIEGATPRHLGFQARY